MIFKSIPTVVRTAVSQRRNWNQQQPARLFTSGSRLCQPAEKQKSHTPESYDKTTESTGIPPGNAHSVSGDDSIQHAFDPPKNAYQSSSKEEPYQPPASDEDEDNLRYGSTGKFNGGPEKDVSQKEEGPEHKGAKGRN